jgi:hypothetical protein
MRKHRNPILSLAILALLSVATCPSQAQDDQAPAPPAHPAIPKLSGNFSLVKKFTYITVPGVRVSLDPASSRLVELDAVKSGAVRKDIRHFANGSGLESWRVQNFRLTMFPDNPQSIVVDRLVATSDPNASYHYRDAADFPELDWASGAAFSSLKMIGDKKCFVYKLGDQSLTVDAATNLPLDYESKTLQVTYTWSAPPDAPLQLPPGAADKIEKFKRRL